MQAEPYDLTGFSRPDLIQYVLANCVLIPNERIPRIGEMRAWCGERFGDDRPGSILFEAMEGQLDYFDGDWGDFPNDLESNQHLFWFSNPSDRTLFTLTWL
jgi:hypothetical protein